MGPDERPRGGEGSRRADQDHRGAMTTDYNPTEAQRLITESRDAQQDWDATAAVRGVRVLSSDYVEGWNDAIGGYALPLADQLEAAGREVERYRADAARAGSERDHFIDENARLRSEVDRITVSHAQIAGEYNAAFERSEFLLKESEHRMR